MYMYVAPPMIVSMAVMLWQLHEYYYYDYYYAIRFAVIDPMHNLFLGTSKNLMTILEDSEVLTETDFQVIQQ